MKTLKLQESKAVLLFLGSDNPRHLRVLNVLMRRPLLRNEMDDIGGCSNAPELVAELRRRGLEIPCERIRFIDRDGRICNPGVYRLSTKDIRLIKKWLKKRCLVSRGKQ